MRDVLGAGRDSRYSWARRGRGGIGAPGGVGVYGAVGGIRDVGCRDVLWGWQGL